MQLAGHEVGAGRPLFLIAGPCVIEGATLTQEIAGRLKEITARLGIPFIFKASYDKANRSSRASFRGPGIEAGLKVLDDVRRAIGVPVLTDVHEDTPLAEVAAVVDVLQTPAFLCRQTNFIVNTASQGKPVNIKKGQFLSPWEMQNVVDKARSTGNEAILVCERGFSFGYNNLVSDMRSLSILRATGCPAARARPPAASASSFRCWRARRSPPGWRGCSWRRIRPRRRRCRMVRTPGRCSAWSRSSAPCASSTGR